MENYRQIKILGKGAFGSAWLVQRIKDNCQFVAKEVRLVDMKPQEREMAKHEIQMLRGLVHPNITRYVDHFEHRGSLFIVMEYANGGDLHNKIKSRRGVRFSEKEILQLFSQICLALLHLHDKHILHRDLKTQNVFLTADGVVKLGDFGISTVLRSTYELKRTVCGTPYYFSPELCLNKPYNNKSDVWALGCILYELTTLTHAFDGTNMKGLVQKILKGVYPPIHPSYSAELSKLVASMLKLDPLQRPSVKQILQLPFLRQFLANMDEEISAEATPSQPQPLQRPLIDPAEQQKLQKEALARVEAARAADQAKQAAAAAALAARAAAGAGYPAQPLAADAREKLRNQRLEQAQQAMDKQIREHEERLKQIRDNQKKYEADQAKKKKEIEERLKEQRRMQEERAAQQLAVQKQREEEWERNMKQQQEEYRRRQEQQNDGAARNVSPAAAAYDASDAARIYREMRREAQANRLRAQENVGGSPPPQQQGGTPYSPVDGRRYSPPQRASPTPPQAALQQNGASPRPPTEVDAEEQRRQAYWQMRREAEDNKRRILGLDPLPPQVLAPPPAKPATPISAQAALPRSVAVSPKALAPASPTPPARHNSPPQPQSPLVLASPPAGREADAAGGDSSDDEDVGYRKFLNGEAIVADNPLPSPSSAVAGAGAAAHAVVVQQQLADVKQAIRAALQETQAGGPDDVEDDFGDPDENDPTRFVLDGQTLHLPNCNSGNPLMSRIESLRLFLEHSMGEQLFVQAYRLMDSVTEDSDDDALLRAQSALPKSMQKFIPVISQLLVCEAFFNKQQ